MGGFKSLQSATTFAENASPVASIAWRSDLWTDFQNDGLLEVIRFFSWYPAETLMQQEATYQLIPFAVNVPFPDDFAVAANCDLNGDSFPDIFVASSYGSSLPFSAYRNMYPEWRNLSFATFPVEGSALHSNLPSPVCVRSPAGAYSDVVVGRFFDDVVFYSNNGTHLTPFGSIETFGRDLSSSPFVLTGTECHNGAFCLAMIANIAYSGILSHGLFYTRLQNGSFVYEQSISEQALPNNANGASARFADFDGDGNPDIVYIGSMDQFSGPGIVFSQNLGNGTWKCSRSLTPRR